MFKFKALWRLSVIKIAYFVAFGIYVFFAIWYFSNFKITKWANVELTSSNFIESYYWTKKDIFWKKSLDLIDRKVNNHDLKIFLLEKYSDLIPVDQWWSYIRPYKESSLAKLINIYKERGDWESLERVANEYIKIDPYNSTGWLHLGIASESKGDIGSAIKYYKSALSIDRTHSETIKRLSLIYINSGEYNKAYETILPNIYQLSSGNSFCFFWASDDFSADKKVCSDTKVDEEFIIPIDTEEADVTMLRIDPPEGKVTIESIFLRSFSNDELEIDGFENWKTSRGLKKEKDGVFVSVDRDPYLFTKSYSSIDLSKFDYLIIKATVEPNIEKDINKTLTELEQVIY